MITPSLEKQIENQLEEINLKLVEVKEIISGSVKTLRITICDPLSHINHQHCIKASKSLRPLIDSQPDNWTLEVWSPGVGRELKSKKDFELFKGKLIEIIQTDEKSTKVEGYLESFSGESLLEGQIEIKIKNENHELNQEFTFKKFPAESIKKVKLALDTSAANDSENSNKPVEISVEDV